MTASDINYFDICRHTTNDEKSQHSINSKITAQYKLKNHSTV